MDLNEKMQELENRIKEIDKKLEEVKGREKEHEQETPFGLISIVDDNLKIELLMQQDLFNEEDIEELTNIVNQLQELIIKVSEREMK